MFLITLRCLIASLVFRCSGPGQWLGTVRGSHPDQRGTLRGGRPHMESAAGRYLSIRNLHPKIASRRL